MKLKTLVIALALVAGLSAAPAQATEKPVIESFTYTPKEVDSKNTTTKVNFELVASHPSGITNQSIFLTLKTNVANLSTNLMRTDNNPAAAKVTFKGTIDIPLEIAAGAYSISISKITNNSSAGYQYESDPLQLPKSNSVIGAETDFLIRNGGELNLVYTTFVGPTYDNTSGAVFSDTTKYNSSVKPILKVGEKFKASDFFEVRVPSLSLSIATTTPTVCTANGGEMTFIATGLCAFSVSTPKTKDYAAKKIDQFLTITAARVKPELVIEKIENKLASDVGKSIELPRVYSFSSGYIFGVSTTPAVCAGNSFSVRLLSVGTCKLTYQTEATAEYAASDVYTQEFIIGTATPAATPTATPAPVAKKKTITCVKSKKSTKGPASRKVTGTNPKCSTGYKLKK